ncbi:unnamed protein product [marine sediment metagenome]|uniref:Uncharacterized protein n=1 Tax=marine sediment metagenome TaxID=412755 RepID=X1DAT8_9ZZZZ
MIKSFRGLLKDGGQEKIPLHTNDGRTGYRIVKFQLMHDEPGEEQAEHTVKVYKLKQSTIDNTINFSDNTLLAAGYIMENPNNAYPVSKVIVFDNEIFNQDIYITQSDTIGSRACNYYIELEEVRLGSLEATVVTLKDMRGRNTT